MVQTLVSNITKNHYNFVVAEPLVPKTRLKVVCASEGDRNATIFCQMSSPLGGVVVTRYGDGRTDINV